MDHIDTLSSRGPCTYYVDAWTLLAQSPLASSALIEPASLTGQEGHSRYMGATGCFLSGSGDVQAL